MDDETQAYIRGVVDAAPPLSDSQRSRLAALFATPPLSDSQRSRLAALFATPKEDGVGQVAVEPEFAELREVLGGDA